MQKEEAITSCLLSEQKRLYRLAYSYVKNEEDALDAIQTAACRALEKQDSLRDLGNPLPWLCRIVVNASTDILRQRSRTAPLEAWQDPGQEDSLPDDSLARQVEALPPEVGTVIRLRYYEEMSLKEISTATGANLSTVKTRLYAGLKKLRVMLEDCENGAHGGKERGHERIRGSEEGV